MKNFKRHVLKAYDYTIKAQHECDKKAQHECDKAVQVLMMEKGFDKSCITQFSGCMASGGEIIISYNSDCNMSDLLIQTAVDMTKDEIIDNLLRSAESEQTIEELKSMKG